MTFQFTYSSFGMILINTHASCQPYGYILWRIPQLLTGLFVVLVLLAGGRQLHPPPRRRGRQVHQEQEQHRHRRRRRRRHLQSLSRTVLTSLLDDCRGRDLFCASPNKSVDRTSRASQDQCVLAQGENDSNEDCLGRGDCKVSPSSML